MGEAKRTRRALVTGGAGFIGYHLSKRLLKDGWIVVSVDGMTPYYDLALKRCRLELLQKSNAFTAHEVMLEDMAALTDAYVAAQPDVVVHLAAQAGVRYSLENPRAYVDANLIGSFNLLELVRNHPPAHFLLASTSSVYGANTVLPFGEMDQTDHAMTLYAATKKATEVMSHAYAHLWKVPTTAFRFFTVYGPWGRPDMALFKFVKAILADQPIDVYGQGDMKRDFTYIDDLIESIVRLIECPPVAAAPVGSMDSLSPVAPHRVVNIGGGHPVDLLGFIKVIEQSLGRRAKLNMLPMQPGDVRATSASAELIEKLIGYKPSTSIEIGVQAFVDWYRSYHKS
jgi:UDP-glucuronate 4-epimerase